MIRNQNNNCHKFLGLLSFFIMVSTCTIDVGWIFTDTGCIKNDINSALLVNSSATIVYYIIYVLLMFYLDENRSERFYLYTKISLFTQHVLNAVVGMPLLFTLMMTHLSQCDAWFEMYMWIRIGISFCTSCVCIPLMYCMTLRDAPYRYDALHNTYNVH